MSKYVDKTYIGNDAPSNKHVLWIDISLETPILKSYLNGKWRQVSGANAFKLVDTEEYPTLNDFLASDGEQGVIYLYPNGTLSDYNRYNEYIWVNDIVRYELLNEDISGKADKVKNAVEGNFAGIDSNGNLIDSGKTVSDFATAEQGVKAEAAKNKADNAVSFAESQTLTDAQRNTALANVSNQTANSTTGKMGYKVLDPARSFSLQVTAENTIYEIRDVFDLNNSSVTIPANCTLKFEGGKINNGSIVGDFNVDSIDYKIGNFTSNGYNIIGNECVTSSQIGMIPNADTTDAKSINDAILQKVITNCGKIVLDNLYYLTGRLDVYSHFTIEGGGLRFTGAYNASRIKLYENAGIEFYNTDIIGDGTTFIFSFKINYIVDTIKFDNCNIKGVRIANCSSDDIDYEVTPFGVNNLIVQNCNVESQTGLLIFTNTMFLKTCKIFNNHFVNPRGSCFYLAIGDESAFHNNRKYNCDIIIESNSFVGGLANHSDYYTPYLIEANRVFVKNNVISNYIMVGTGVAYEGYVNSTEYHFEGNVVKNVCSLPSSGSPNSTPSEIFKCKGTNYRYAKNNKWIIDFNECRQILADNNITFTDEQFDAIDFVTIFIIAYQTQLLDFEFNEVKIKGGYLKLSSPSQSPVKKVVINNNKFDIEKLKNNSTSFFTIGSEYNEEAHFENNDINITTVQNNVLHVFSGYSSVTNARSTNAYIRGNTCNVALSVPFITSSTFFTNNNVGVVKTNAVLYLYNPTNGGIINIDNFKETTINYYQNDIKDVSINILTSTYSNIIFGSSNRSGGMRFTMPKYNISKSYYFEHTSNNWKVTDEYGVVIYNGAEPSSSNVINIIKVNNYQGVFISGTTIKVSCGYGDVFVEFTGGKREFGTYSAGTTRYNPTAGRMELWNGTAWVNLDGTPLS